MADGIVVDVSEVLALAERFDMAGSLVMQKVDQVVERGALNVKNAMRDRFGQSRHFKQIASHVRYDRVGKCRYEIGPTVGGAGSLAGIAVEGGANGGGGTVKIDDLAEAELPAIADGIGRCMDGVLG